MGQWMQKTHRKGSYGWLNSCHRSRHYELVNKMDYWWLGVRSDINSSPDAEVRAVFGDSYVWQAWQGIASFK